MSVVKRVFGDYNIKVDPDSANINLYSHTVFVAGNLFVGGNATQVNKTDLEISDNTITINKGEIGPGVSLGYAGIEVDRGSSQFVPGLRWSEPLNKWQFSNDGVTYANIAFSTGTGGMALIDDPAPQLGGPLDTLDQYIFSSNTQQIKMDSNLAMYEQSVSPTAISSYNILYANVPNGGGSGVYQTSISNSDELVSRNRALVFSLVL